jgi:hypothetical protein
LGILFTSCVLNVIKLFQYQLDNEYFLQQTTFPLVNDKFYTRGLFLAMNIIIYSIFNNFFILFSLLLFDIRLYRFLKRSLEAKSKLKNPISQHKLKEQIKNLNEKKSQTKADDNFIRLVIVTGLHYFTFHILDLFIFIYLATVNESIFKNVKIFLKLNRDHVATLEYITYISISDLFNLFSLTFYFFIYLKYNKNFKNSFYSLFTR